MKHFKIRSWKDHSILYEGSFKNFCHAAEHAKKDGVSFDYADFSHMDLTNCVLDYTRFKHAKFNNTNLAGSNFSKCFFESCDFSHSLLLGASLYDSDITDCVFDHTSFGSTDILDCTLLNCQFSGLSITDLHFDKAATISKCSYKTEDEQILPFNAPPLVIRGMKSGPIVVFDHHILLKEDIFERRILGDLTLNEMHRFLKQS